MVAGGMAGFAYWSIAYPFDIVKTRLQGDNLKKPTINSTLHGLKTIAKQGKLYQGLSTTLVRCFPVNAALFGGFELGMKMMEQE